MSEGFLGQIVWFAGSFAPKNWEFCNGELLAITNYQSLYSILGTTFGGDGRTTFALPDLRGRVPLSPGQGPNLSNYSAGEKGGLETVTLTTSQIPTHTHQLVASSTIDNTDVPEGNILAEANENIYSTSSSNLVSMNTAAISNTGGTGHENRQPILATNYIICVNGIYPSRN